MIRHMPEHVGRNYPQRAICGVMLKTPGGPDADICDACTQIYIQQQADANPGNPFWAAKLAALDT